MKNVLINQWKMVVMHVIQQIKVFAKFVHLDFIRINQGIVYQVEIQMLIIITIIMVMEMINQLIHLCLYIYML